MFPNESFYLFTFYLFFSVLLAFTYIAIITRYMSGWNDLPIWEIPSTFNPVTKLSVVIAARNESQSIESCLDSIIKQDYPTALLEIIVVDDHSDDDTAAIIQQLTNDQLHLLQLTSNDNVGKKKALTKGIAQATGQLIVTTDADCICPPNWLNYLASFYENYQYKMIAAPVQLTNEKSKLGRFQSLDFLGMMCVTGAGIHKRFMHMGNGANLCYERSVFKALNGFEGINNLASGDDILLMQKVIQQYPDGVGFLKNKSAAVKTSTKESYSDFMDQRLRWATKSRSYQQFSVTLILSMVFFFCANILLSMFMALFFGVAYFWIFLGQLFVKTIVDYFFLDNISRFFGRQELMKGYFVSQIFHIFYIVGIGTLGNVVKNYSWKGRKVS